MVTIKPKCHLWPQLLLWLIFSSHILAAPFHPTPIVITNANIYTFSNTSWTCFATGDYTTSVTSILRVFQQDQFRPVNQAVFNGGIPKEYLWFHFTLRNEDTVVNPIFIDIESPRINELELFERSDSGIRSLGRLGDFFPFNKRKITHKNFVYRTTLAHGATKDYFLFVNQVGHTLVLPVKIYKEKAFQSASFKNYFLDGLTYGILLFVAVLSLLFFFSTRHFLYLFYGLYLLSAIAWFLSYFGLGYQYIWGDHPRVSTLSAPLFACLNLILNIQICQILLRLKKVDSTLYKAGNIAKFFLAAAGLFPVLVDLNKHGYTYNHLYLVIFLIIILLSVLVVFISVMFYSIKGSAVARFYLLSSLLKTGSIFNLALLEFGISPALYDMEGMLQAGIMIEISMLTAAIAQRYTLYRLKFFRQVITAQETERDKISKEIHDSISNSLSGIRYAFLNLMAVEKDFSQPVRNRLEEIASEIGHVQKEARHISHYMMPEYILRSSLTDIIKKYITDIENTTLNNGHPSSMPLINFSSNKPPVKFPQPVKLNIFRIIQELISNIQKHSRASSAEIVLSFEKKHLLIISEDNGLGFPVNGTDATGIGITNIRSRVSILNGNFNIQTSNKKGREPAFQGTLITIRIPYYSNIQQKEKAYDY